MTLASGALAALSLAPGDMRRPRVGRAVFGGLLLAVVFEAFAWTVKEVRPLGAHAPWADDPYDVVTSFAIFFVPFLAAVTAVRVPFCRRIEPLLLDRVRGLIRGVTAIVVVTLVAVVSDWGSVLAGANTSTWSQVTPLLVGGLALVSVLLAVVGVELLRVAGHLPVEARIETAGQPLASGPDWVADVLGLARLACMRLGAPGRLGVRLIDLFDRSVAAPVRRHPVSAAAALAAAFAIALTAAAATEEGIRPVLVLFLGVGWCAMFAFLIIASSYLELVRPVQPLAGVQKRLLRATMAACVAVPVALAFREALWSLAGAPPGGGSVEDLARLVIAAGAATFVLTIGVDALRRGRRPVP